jgi:hypothetical protein
VLDIGTADAFVPGGVGIQAANKIRLLHSLIRYMLVRDPNAASTRKTDPIPPWQPDKLGIPISQEFLAATLLTFHYVILQCMERLCLKLTEAEKCAYMQRWNAAGWFLGIETATLEKLKTMDDGKQLYDLVMARRRQTTEHGHALSATLLKYVRNNIIEGVSGGILNPLLLVPRVLTRYLSGRETSAALSMELSFLDALLYLPIVIGTRSIGYLDNFPAFQSITRSMTLYAARHIWRFAHPHSVPMAEIESGNGERSRPTAVFAHDDLAAAWGMTR